MIFDIQFQYADFNVLISKQFFVAKGVRFLRVQELIKMTLNCLIQPVNGNSCVSSEVRYQRINAYQPPSPHKTQI